MSIINLHGAAKFCLHCSQCADEKEKKDHQKTVLEALRAAYDFFYDQDAMMDVECAHCQQSEEEPDIEESKSSCSITMEEDEFSMDAFTEKLSHMCLKCTGGEKLIADAVVKFIEEGSIEESPSRLSTRKKIEVPVKKKEEKESEINKSADGGVLPKNAEGICMN